MSKVKVTGQGQIEILHPLADLHISRHILEERGGKMFDLRSSDCGFEPHRHCIVSLSKTLYPLLQPRRTLPDITEKLLTGM